MKRARAYLEQGQVLSSYWAPPLLRGVVQAGEVSFRASMVIKSGIDIENLCTCREAREWGKICAHGVAVGLHWLKAQKPRTAPTPARRQSAARKQSPAKKASALQRDAAGEPAELFIILPPNFDQAVARGKVMLVFEAKWSGGRCPLNALPKGRSFAFSAAGQCNHRAAGNVDQRRNARPPADGDEGFCRAASGAGGASQHHARQSQRSHSHQNAVETCRCAPRWRRMGKLSSR